MAVPKAKLGIVLTFFLALLATYALAQGMSPLLKAKVERQRHARIMFYNCENLFDTVDDTLKNDESFLPEGDHYWSYKKYRVKLANIAKTITAVGGWHPPELVGLCEVENYHTLHDLTRNSPLYRFEYKIIHNESPDKRGIDVALLYQPKAFKPIKNNFITINFPDSPDKKTRQILYSKGVLQGYDTIHLFVNHWPSRWGGQMESEDYRVFVASVLKKQIDSIFMSAKSANIIIMGDFNDEPTNKSLSIALAANLNNNGIIDTALYNITHIANSKKHMGTHKYRGNWAIFDQFVVSGNLLDSNNGLFTSIEKQVIFNADFLLEPDNSFLGKKPFRTFVGFRYNGGFSDHLPIFLDLLRVDEKY